MENRLYISRTESWLDRYDDSLGISEYEWQSYIKTDHELKLVKNSHNTVMFYGESIYFEKGEIYYVDPDELAFYKLLEIANTIDACIRGEDGRQYITISWYFYPIDVSKPKRRPALLKFEKEIINRRRVWWKRLLNIGTVK